MNEQVETIVAETIHEFTVHLNKICTTLRDFRLEHIDTTDTIRILRAAESIKDVIAWYAGLYSTTITEEITPKQRHEEITFINNVIKARKKAALTHLVKFCAKHRNGTIDLSIVREVHNQILSLEIREEITIKEILTANAEQL